MKKLLKNRNYSIYLFGHFISLMGSNIQQFILSLYVLDLTGSVTIFSTMIAVSIIPRIVFSPIAGVIGDWFDRKKTIIILDLISSIVILFGILYFLTYNTLHIAVIFSIVILLEIVEIFYSASSSAITPSVVSKEDLLAANSLSTSLFSTAAFLAPMFGALLYGVFGILIGLVFNCISFVVAIIFELFLHLPKTTESPDKITIKSFIIDFKQGLDTIKQSSFITTIISIGMILNFLISPIISIGIIITLRVIMKTSSFEVGLMQSALTLSFIITPMFLKRKSQSQNYGSSILKGFYGISLTLLLISISIMLFEVGYVSNYRYIYIFFLFSMFILGSCTIMVNINVFTIFQKIVPIKQIGRVSSVMNLGLMIMMPLGQISLGFVLNHVQAWTTFILVALLNFVVTMLYAKRIKSFNNNESEASQQPHQEQLAHA